MKKPGNCEIEQTVAALEQAIKNKKTRIENAKAVQSAQTGHSMSSHLFSSIMQKAGGSYAQIGQLLEHGKNFVGSFIGKAQHNLEERPWEVLHKVAVSSFGIGLFLGLRRRKSSTRKRE